MFRSALGDVCHGDLFPQLGRGAPGETFDRIGADSDGGRIITQFRVGSPLHHHRSRDIRSRSRAFVPENTVGQFHDAFVVLAIERGRDPREGIRTVVRSRSSIRRSASFVEDQACESGFRGNGQTDAFSNHTGGVHLRSGKNLPQILLGETGRHEQNEAPHDESLFAFAAELVVEAIEALCGRI